MQPTFLHYLLGVPVAEASHTIALESYQDSERPLIVHYTGTLTREDILREYVFGLKAHESETFLRTACTPLSFYAYFPSAPCGNLHDAEDRKTLVFADQTLIGEIRLGMSLPQPPPYIYECPDQHVLIRVGERTVDSIIPSYVGYENWLAWRGDPLIREKLLHESVPRVIFPLR